MNENKNSINHTLIENDQICFIHIPKTAGMTLRKLLMGYYGSSHVSEVLRWYELPETPINLSSYKVLTGHVFYEINKLLPKKPFFITMLRKPIERSISQYKQISRHLLNDSEKGGGIKINSISEMLLDTNYIGHFKNLQTRFIGSKFDIEIKSLQDIKHARELIDDVDIGLAKKRLSDFTFVGLVERIKESFDLLAFTFNLLPVLQIPKVNVSEEKLNQTELPDTIVQHLIELNSLDVELYQYAEELFDERYLQMMDTLLLNNYENNHPQLNHGTQRTIEYYFEEPIPGNGWHVPEVVNENRWVWTGPGTKSSLFFPLHKDSDVKILFKIRLYMSKDILDSLSLTANGSRIDIIRNEVNGEILYHGIIPKEVLMKGKFLTKFIFQVNRTTLPNSTGSVDKGLRYLGVAFEWIKIHPA